MSYEEERNNLVRKLRSKGYIKSKKVTDAIKKVPRHLFVPEHIRERAYMDSPQPIGDGQTISAPHMVAMMVEELEVKYGHKILEVGGGRGYHAAVLAELVGEDGMIYTVERIRSLGEAAEAALRKGGYDNVKVVIGDGSKGYSKRAPYDRVSVACGAPDIPRPLIKQLKKGGQLLLPVGGRFYQELTRVTKTEDKKIKKEDLGGVVFVPLKGKHGY